jgi:D-glycero-alpha-D-manno-heptose 1-phosphate guanylyltransferase
MTTTAIILAGGLGTRLRSAVPNLPKCLAPVGRRSFLEIQLQQLHSQGVSKFVLSLGYMADAVISQIGHLSEIYDITYVIEKELLGTGGAARFAFQKAGLDNALVANGDTFLDGNLHKILNSSGLSPNILFKMAAIEVEDRTRYGGLDQKDGLLTGFFEKGTSGRGLINAGLYSIESKAFDLMRGLKTFSLETDLLPKLVNIGSVSVEKIDGFFIDIGIPEDYKKFCGFYG